MGRNYLLPPLDRFSPVAHAYLGFHAPPLGPAESRRQTVREISWTVLHVGGSRDGKMTSICLQPIGYEVVDEHCMSVDFHLRKNEYTVYDMRIERDAEVALHLLDVQTYGQVRRCQWNAVQSPLEIAVCNLARRFGSRRKLTNTPTVGWMSCV